MMAIVIMIPVVIRTRKMIRTIANKMKMMVINATITTTAKQ